jgi:hypothetical protein
MKDKLWYFGSYEGERKPDTATTVNLVTGSSFSHPNTLRVNEYLGRGDYQLSEKNRIFLRGDGFTYKSDYLGVSGNADPSRAYQGTRTSYGFVADWNTSIRSNLVNDLRAGYHHFGWQNLPYTQSMEIIFANITVGGPYNYPQIFAQNSQDYRDDVFWLKGKHTLKFGGEYIYTGHGGYFQQNVRGRVNPCSASINAAQYSINLELYCPQLHLRRSSHLHSGLRQLYCRCPPFYPRLLASGRLEGSLAPDVESRPTLRQRPRRLHRRTQAEQWPAGPWQQRQ